MGWWPIVFQQIHFEWCNFTKSHFSAFITLLGWWWVSTDNGWSLRSDIVTVQTLSNITAFKIQMEWGMCYQASALVINSTCRTKPFAFLWQTLAVIVHLKLRANGNWGTDNIQINQSTYQNVTSVDFDGRREWLQCILIHRVFRHWRTKPKQNERNKKLNFLIN